MSFFRTWLLGVVAAAMAVALAQALTPEGTVKKAGRLVGGLVLLLAVGKPLLTLDPGELAVTTGAYFHAPEQAETGGEEMLKALIAQETGAYIEDKGRSLGFSCRAKVTVTQGEGGWPQPWSVEIVGSWSEEGRQALETMIAETLAIPGERQSFREERP